LHTSLLVSIVTIYEHFLAIHYLNKDVLYIKAIKDDTFYAENGKSFLSNNRINLLAQANICTK